MKRLLLCVLLLTNCGRQVRVQPTQHPAYNVTTHTGWEFIAKIPMTRDEKTLDMLRKIASCVDPGPLIFEVIRLQRNETIQIKKK